MRNTTGAMKGKFQELRKATQYTAHASGTPTTGGQAGGLNHPFASGPHKQGGNHETFP